MPNPRLSFVRKVQAAAWATTADREAAKSSQPLSTKPRPPWQEGRGEKGAGIASTALLVCGDLLTFLTVLPSLPDRAMQPWND